MKLKESTTFVNLARAFAGECQDGARYQFLKDKAEREGLAYVGQICTCLLYTSDAADEL